MSNSVQTTEFTPKLHDRGNGMCLIRFQNPHILFLFHSECSYMSVPLSWIKKTWCVIPNCKYSNNVYAGLVESATKITFSVFSMPLWCAFRTTTKVKLVRRIKIINNYGQNRFLKESNSVILLADISKSSKLLSKNHMSTHHLHDNHVQLSLS